MSILRFYEQADFVRWFGDSKVVRERADGSTVPLKVYHSTDALRFTTFEAGELGFHFGDLAAARFIGGKRIIAAYLSIQNPLWINYDVGIWYDPTLVLKAVRGYIDNPATVLAACKRLAAPLQELIDGDDDSFARSKALYAVTRPIREALQARGYDGISYQNEAEGFGISWIAFNANQVKSARNSGRWSEDADSILDGLR